MISALYAVVISCLVILTGGTQTLLGVLCITSLLYGADSILMYASMKQREKEDMIDKHM